MTLIDRSFKEQIVIVGIREKNQTKEDLQQDLDELTSLIDTAGAEVIGRLIQNHPTKDPTFLLSPGKVQELADICQVLDPDTVVFDQSLSPAQQSNLEKLLKRTAIDREAVILDIFAQNAHSIEGKLQVELAMLKYRLTRLSGRGVFMSRLAGGIGTRGPGESQLESDRRRIKARISKLEKDLKALSSKHRIQRRRREKNGVFEISLVGYTNAGKSSIHRAITNTKSAFVDSKLFSTLDAKTAHLKKYYDLPIVVSDTVGFIKKLPHNLISAFNSTLSQITSSDLILHIVDASDHRSDEKIKIVRSVLNQIGAGHIQELLVLNKIDLDLLNANALMKFYNADAMVSAKTKIGLDHLINLIADFYKAHCGSYSPNYNSQFIS